MAFGLIEWAVEHFVHIEGREKSALIDAGIALGVFLAFHRVRDFVEHYIESWFFHSWHSNEAQLRTFVKEASFVGKAAALAKAFVDELTRFSGGATCALYEASASRTFTLKGGEGAAVMDGDDVVVVKMRAGRDLVEAADGLYLPIIYRTDLTGFIRMGLKPGGEGYRPDECEVLTYAAHSVGLDLHALKVEELEQVQAEQKQQIAVLSGQVEFARRLGAKNTPRSPAKT